MVIKRKIKITLTQIRGIFRKELDRLRFFAKIDSIRSGVNFNSRNYYCGITNDIHRREREHNANFLCYVRVNNVHMARSIEIAMKFYGYDTGRRSGNGGKPDSVYVYIQKD